MRQQASAGGMPKLTTTPGRNSQFARYERARKGLKPLPRTAQVGGNACGNVFSHVHVKQAVGTNHHAGLIMRWEVILAIDRLSPNHLGMIREGETSLSRVDIYDWNRSVSSLKTSRWLLLFRPSIA